MTDKKEIFGKSIRERCVLMVRNEADVACGCPQLGEDVYEAWVGMMDASRPEDYYISDLVEELALKYLTSEAVVESLFETIRQMILDYEELIDRV